MARRALRAALLQVRPPDAFPEESYCKSCSEAAATRRRFRKRVSARIREQAAVMELEPPVCMAKRAGTGRLEDSSLETPRASVREEHSETLAKENDG
jgi:hypothetical protein